MNAIKNPIPAEIPSFKSFGIVLTIFSRKLVIVSTIKITPSMKTAANAICHVTLAPLIVIAPTTLKAK